MYYLYIDESGVEGETRPNLQKNLDSDWFSSGGIIVDEEGKQAFSDVYDEIIETFFDKNGINLPQDFKLHYRELRQKQFPYDQLTDRERWRIADGVFNAITTIDCRLISATINKVRHRIKYPTWTVNVRAYTLLLSLERFQYFLEDTNESGTGIYEKLTNSMLWNIEKDLMRLKEIPTFPFFTNLDKIKGKINNGNPLTERVLSFLTFLFMRHTVDQFLIMPDKEDGKK